VLELEEGGKEGREGREEEVSLSSFLPRGFLLLAPSTLRPPKETRNELERFFCRLSMYPTVSRSLERRKEKGRGRESDSLASALT